MGAYPLIHKYEERGTCPFLEDVYIYTWMKVDTPYRDEKIQLHWDRKQTKPSTHGIT